MCDVPYSFSLLDLYLVCISCLSYVIYTLCVFKKVPYRDPCPLVSDLLIVQ